MKKGIQYSHYCGTELAELVSGIWMCMELQEEDKEESQNWGQYSLDMVLKLRDKIAELDKLNGMDY